MSFITVNLVPMCMYLPKKKIPLDFFRMTLSPFIYKTPYALICSSVLWQNHVKFYGHSFLCEKVKGE